MYWSNGGWNIIGKCFIISINSSSTGKVRFTLESNVTWEATVIFPNWALRKLNWVFFSYFFLNYLCISHKIWVSNTSSVHANFFFSLFSTVFVDHYGLSICVQYKYMYIPSITDIIIHYHIFVGIGTFFFYQKRQTFKKKKASTRTPTIWPTLCVWTMMVTLWTIPQLISWNCRNLLLHPSHKLHLLQLHQTKNPVSRPNGTSTTGTFLISTILRAFQRQVKTKTEVVRMVS